MFWWAVGGIAGIVSALIGMKSSREAFDLSEEALAEDKEMRKVQLESAISTLTYNIGKAERDVEATEEAGGREMGKLARKGESFLSTQRSYASAAGVKAGEGSPLSVMSETASLIEADKLELQSQIDKLLTDYGAEIEFLGGEKERYQSLLDELYPEEEESAAEEPPSETTGPSGGPKKAVGTRKAWGGYWYEWNGRAWVRKEKATEEEAPAVGKSGRGESAGR